MRDLWRVFKDLLGYIRKNRKLWLIPVVVALFVMGLLIATAGNSPVPVFVYPLA